MILSGQSQALTGSTTPGNLNFIFRHAIKVGQPHLIIFCCWTASIPPSNPAVYWWWVQPSIT